MPCTNRRCNHALCQLQKYLLCPRTFILVVILGIVLMMPRDEQGVCSICCVYKMVLKTACGFLELCVHLIELPLSIICSTKSRLNMILEFAMSKCSNIPCCATGATKPLPPPPGPVPEKRSSSKKLSVTSPLSQPKIVEEPPTGATEPMPPPLGPVPEKRSSSKKLSVTLPLSQPKIVEEPPTGATEPLPPPPGPVPEKRSSSKKLSVTSPLSQPKIVEEPPTIHIREETKEDVQVLSARASVVEIKRASIAPEPEPNLEVELEQSKETEEIIKQEKKSTVIIEPKKNSATIIALEHESEEPEPEVEVTEPELEERELESEEPEPESGEPEPESEEPEPESEEPEPESEEPEPESEEPEPDSEEPEPESQEPEPESEEPQLETEELKEELPFELIHEPSVAKGEKKIEVKREREEPVEDVTVEGVCKRYTPKRCSKCRCAKRKEARKRRSFEQGRYKNKKSTEGTTPDFGNVPIQTDLNKDECCMTKSQSKCVGTERCCRFKGKKLSNANPSGSKRSSLKLKNVKRPSEGLISPSVFIPSSTGSKHRKKSSDSVQSSSRRKSASPESKRPSTISHKSAPSSILGIDERGSSKRSSLKKKEIIGSTKSPSAEFKPLSLIRSAESDRCRCDVRSSANLKDSRHKSERSREEDQTDRDVKISESQTKWSEKLVAQTSKASHRRRSYTRSGDSKCSLPTSLVDDYTQTSFTDEKTKDKMQQIDTEVQKETSAEPKQRPCMCYHKELCRDNCLGRRDRYIPEKF